MAQECLFCLDLQTLGSIPTVSSSQILKANIPGVSVIKQLPVILASPNVSGERGNMA